MPSIQETIKLTDFAYQKDDISFLQTLEANRQYVDAQMGSVQLKALLVSRQAEILNFYLLGFAANRRQKQS